MTVSPPERSWWRWLLVCRAGRRCANVVVVPDATNPPLPPEWAVMVDYICEGCGRHYRRKVNL